MNNRLKRKLLPIIILSFLIIITIIIIANPPETQQRHTPTVTTLTVEAMTIVSKTYKMHLHSYGKIKPQTKSMLVAQVSGQIMAINTKFREGGFFEQGDVLLTIDPRDYQADVNIAQATLVQSQQTLIEEQARSKQASNDWSRLGNTGKASDLVLRKPQLLAAKARLISAQSMLDKAQFDLERTQIIAPFSGRILNKKVDIGQVVAANTQLAEIYATEVIEIRLPLKNSDLKFIDLPENYRFKTNANINTPSVKILSTFNTSDSWQGKIVRTESSIDDTTRQLHVVAQIDDPFGIGSQHKTPLKIGQYVTAQITGKQLDNALIIPNQSIYQGSYVYIVNNGLLQRRNISIAWQNETEALIKTGLNSGDILVLTSLGQVTSGVKVIILADKDNNKPIFNQVKSTPISTLTTRKSES